MAFLLSGKKALVTGATGGIGSAICRLLLEQGASIVMSGTNDEKLADLKGKLQEDISDGKVIDFVRCNLSQQDEVHALAEKAADILGGVDILVNNAGITSDNLAMRMKLEDWQKVIDINLTATFILSKAVLRGMFKQKFGRIIMISSVVAHSGNPGQANYCASKGGIEAMARSLAQESASRGVTVNNIAPGFIATNMTEQLNDQQKEVILQKIPMAKMGSPNDIAAAVAFLASEESGYITGTTMHVNGGMYC